jgi:hypothetical protein
MNRKDREDSGLLRAYAVVITMLLSLVSLAALARRSRRLRIDSLDVERINVIEADGTPRMVISNTARAPHPMVDGKTFFNRAGGNSAGVIFYNDEGDECGGLIYRGRRAGGRYDASAGLTLDQFKQDQTVAIHYDDQDGSRSAGLTVWDRPVEPLPAVIARQQSVWAMPEGPERTEAIERMQAEGLLGATRLFAGKTRSKEAALQLHDASGNVRLRLAVDATGTARLEFLDEGGRVIYALPDGAQGSEGAPSAEA